MKNDFYPTHNLSYGRWLVMVRKALKSTGYFKKGVRPCTKHWRHYYDEGFRPNRAVEDDMGIQLSFYWNFKG
jgi:hypothetical protein